MRILLARTAGFCMGVRRAMKLAVEARLGTNTPVYTQGDLIHNAQAVELLASREISPLPNEPISENATILIRAHGVSPGERETIAQSGATIIDATCPHVVQSQERIRAACAEGRSIILVGDPGHPEVQCLHGSATTSVYLVPDKDSAAALQVDTPCMVLAQTTFATDKYEAIKEIFRKRISDVVIHDSICRATGDRQAEVRELIQQAQALVVVGGKHSANTARLAEIGRDAGVPTYHVETADELDPAAFANLDVVAVTAGASTPGWMTEQVIDRLESFSSTNWRDRGWLLLRFATQARLLTAASAYALGYAVFCLAGMHPARHDFLGIIAVYVFIAHILNRREAPEERTRAVVILDRFFDANARFLYSLCAFLALGLLGFAATRGMEVLGILAVAMLAAVLYPIRIRPWSKRHPRIKDIPGSKDLAVAKAQAFLIAGLAYVAQDGALPLTSALAAGAWVFFLGLAKRILLDLRDVESDHLLGIDTLPMVIGKGRAEQLVQILLVVASVGGFLLPSLDGITALGSVLVVIPLVGLALVYQLRRMRFRGEIECQVAVELWWLLAGVIALVWSAI